MKKILLSMLLTPAFAIAANTPATLNPLATTNNYLKDIDSKIGTMSLNNKDVANLSSILGNSALDPSKVKQNQLLDLANYTQLFCQANEAEGYYLSTSWASSTDARTQCQNALKVANANSVLPLDMSLQTQVTVPESADTDNTTDTGNTSSDNTFKAIDAYIGSLLTAPVASAGVPNTFKTNTAPELSMVSSVLRSIANVYQSGEMSQINTSVDTPFGAGKTAFDQKVASANTPELLRMLVLENAKSNFINARALTQRQKTNALLAVILADQVKIRALENASVYQQQKLTRTNQLLQQILNEQMRQARKSS